MIDVRESTDKLKILIVDDSELNRELLAGMLGDEYEIYQVENGKKAIDILEENREQFKLVQQAAAEIGDDFTRHKYAGYGWL